LSDEQQPIVIRKKKGGGHGGHHGGAWKVALADFMTAMMAFFLVMWLVGQKPEVREAVAGYFRNPGEYEKQGKSGVFKGSSSVIPADAASLSLNIQKKDEGGDGSEKQRKALKLTARNIYDQLKKQKEFDRLKNNVRLEMTTEGLRITLNESEDGAAFFEPGSAKLLQKSAIILMTISRELGKLSNRIALEGHTDASGGDRGEYTNWELSADRANAARRLMEVSGLKPDQVLEVRGFADQFPMMVAHPNDPRNRRVTIVVLYENRAYGLDHLEVGEDLVSEMGG
jgi:chemotaxis protein MotB